MIPVRRDIDNANAWNPRVLSARSDRPRGRTTNNSNELPPSHRIPLVIDNDEASITDLARWALVRVWDGGADTNPRGALAWNGGLIPLSGRRPASAARCARAPSLNV